MVRNSDVVIDVVFGRLRAVQQTSQMPAHLDTRAEVTSLAERATSAGLGASVLAGQESTDQALVLRYHILDRLLPASRRRATSPAARPLLRLLKVLTQNCGDWGV